MPALHFEFLVEEPSMEAFLNGLLPRLLPQDRSFQVYPFQGKQDLLSKLRNRLRGYAAWMPEDYRIVVLVDRDEEDCNQLKQRLEAICSDAGLCSRTATGEDRWQIVNRIAIEELEAWFFGDVAAMKKAYPRISQTLDKKAAYRDPDAISGGTWERLEKLLIDYHPGGLEKIRAAEEISRHMAPDNNCSKSFQVFRDSLKRIFA